MSQIRKSAEGQECQVRIPGVCNFNTETTVFAHLNGGGMGRKHPDILGAYCCSDCHDAYDRRNISHYGELAIIDKYFYEGVFRTQLILLERGMIVIK